MERTPKASGESLPIEWVSSLREITEEDRVFDQTAEIGVVSDDEGKTWSVRVLKLPELSGEPQQVYFKVINK